MGSYGSAAVRATELLRARDVSSPRDAWAKSVRREFPRSVASREKSCPRDAFLGLCEDGRVRGVRPGSYTRSRLNKLYTLQAVKILRAHPNLASDELTLWNRVMNGRKKTPNNQMEVVVALWRRRLLRH